MCALGFDHYIEPLTLYLHKYRETTKSDRNLNTNDLSSNESSSATTTQSTIIATGGAGSTGTTYATNSHTINVPSANGNIVVTTLPTTNDTTLYYQNGTQQRF